MEKGCTIRCPVADPLWDFLEEKRKEAGLDTIEEIALRMLRTSLGLPAEYQIWDALESKGKK